MISTENPLGDRRHTLARTVVLLAMLIAFSGTLLGVVFGIMLGTVTGSEARIIEFSTVLTGAMLVLFYFKPESATSVIAGVLTVYFIFYLNAGSILAYRASGDFLRIVPYVIWFFPLVVFHELTNFSRYKRPISGLVALSPIPNSAYVISHPTTPVAIGVLDASVTFLVSFFAFVLFIHVFTRNRDDEIVRSARTEEADRAAAVLRISNERFRIIANAVSDALWDYDLEKKKWWLAPGWSQRLGMEFDEKEVSLSDWPQSVDEEDRKRVVSSFMKALASDADTWSVEFQLKDHDGHTAAISANASLIRNPVGRVTRMLGNARNITAEKRQQEGYSRARALEAVGQLTGGVAHDFNNQLMIIQGNAELLEMSELDEDQAESVALINQACSGAADLTQRLLSFSRQSHLQIGRVDLTRLVPNTVALLRAGIPESITIQCKVPANTWQAKADANALEQAIVNLAVNARDAMPGGGDIVIDCENRTVSNDILPFKSELEPGDYVVVSVTDNGAGMSSDVLARAFEPFFTTKDVGKGTGLGLSTVYGFATQSDGRVIIYSEPEQGTTVKLFLPRFLEAGAEEEQATETKIARPGNGQRILLVEDQPQLRAHVEKLITKMGYLVTSAGNGKEALSLFDDGLEFDLLFTDVIMPGGINGQQLAEEVRKLDPRMKVLFTSGYPSFAFEHLNLDEIDSIRLLKKPYRSIELAAILAELFVP